MPDLIPYLAFNGNCADAMRFYERALEGKLETHDELRRFAHGGPGPQGVLAPDHACPAGIARRRHALRRRRHGPERFKAFTACRSH